MDAGIDAAALEAARAELAGARRIAVLTGAGISTDSGIPDFRGPNGVWTRNPKAERTSDIRYYISDPEVRRLAWLHRLDTPIWTAEPNAGHRALVELERQQRLLGIVTQNIDGLHQAAGNAPELVIEVHGTVRFTRCLSCDDVRPMAEALDRVRAGEEDPPCRLCGAIIKSDTISFGQSLVPEVIERAFRVAAECDLLLAVGSTLSVQPVANCVPIAARSGATVVIVNASPTDMDAIADHVVRGPIAQILPALVAAGR